MAKDLSNGWTSESYQRHYLGCMKGAVHKSLAQKVDSGEITRQTSQEDRKKIIKELMKLYKPLCTCVQDEIVKNVMFKDIHNKSKDKEYRDKVTKLCIKKHSIK
ncbi:MAG: hypothetical protein OEZ33_04865 [Gammaproteobacteria bacterium]|nr:hypothetical protein [Gammaproteobacteria bacterium]